MDVEIVTLSGSVEVAPALGLADAIVELTATGSTLLVHEFQTLDVILESEAALVANRAALEHPAKRATIDRLLMRLSSAQAARAHKYVMMNAPRAALPQIQAMTPGLKAPTIVPLSDPDWVAVHTVIKEDDVLGHHRATAGRGRLGDPGDADRKAVTVGAGPWRARPGPPAHQEGANGSEHRSASDTAILIPIKRLADLDATDRARILRRAHGTFDDVFPVVEASWTPCGPRGRRVARVHGPLRRGAPGRSGASATPSSTRRGPSADPALLEALAVAARNITAFHSRHVAAESAVTPQPGVRALAGLAADRARGAVHPRRQGGLPLVGADERDPGAHRGCGEIVICTPPNRDGPGEPGDLAGGRPAGRAAGVQAGRSAGHRGHGLWHGERAARLQAVRRRQPLGHGGQAPRRKPGAGGHRSARPARPSCC